MTFEQEIAITLLDKGVLAVGAVVLGFFFNRWLQSWRARDEALKEIAHDRVEAFRSLWRITINLPASSDPEATLDEPTRVALDRDLSDWYYRDGALLSWKATEHLFKSLRYVREGMESPNAKAVRDGLSSLRTQLKRDCGVYSWSDARRQLPTPPGPLPRPDRAETHTADRGRTS